MRMFSCIYCELIYIDKFPFIFLQQNLDASHLKKIWNAFCWGHFASTLSRFLKIIFISDFKSLRILDELKFSSGILSLVFSDCSNCNQFSELTIYSFFNIVYSSSFILRLLVFESCFNVSFLFYPSFLTFERIWFNWLALILNFDQINDADHPI